MGQRRSQAPRSAACDVHGDNRHERRRRGLRLVAVDEILPLGEPEVARVAAVQRGVVTVGQLHAAGFDGNDVERRVRLGRLHPHLRGVYLVGHAEAAPLAAETAALLALGSGSLLSHGSAAKLGGWLAAPPEIHVSVIGRRPRARSGVRPHFVPSLDRRDWCLQAGLPVTRPARTLVDLAAAGMPEDALDRAIAEAIATRRTTVPEVHAAMARASDRRGRKLLGELLASGPADLRSEGERLLLAMIRRAGLPQPETNIRLGTWTVDFMWRERRLIVELDGADAHRSPWARDRDARKTVELEQAGWRVVRFTGRQLRRRPEWVLAQLAALLLR